MYIMSKIHLKKQIIKKTFLNLQLHKPLLQNKWLTMFQPLFHSLKF